MPYIPEQHRKYDLLPWSREHGGEVFEYPSELLYQVTALLPKGETLDPYGYDSYEEYFADVDSAKRKYAVTEEDRRLFDRFRAAMLELNRKEDWSVLRYVGESDDRLFGITHGQVYYWPCSRTQPVYSGVIDDEEYTAYLYSTEPEDWEILEDPTGMAYNTLYRKAKGCCSQTDYGVMMRQVEKLITESESDAAEAEIPPAVT